MNNKTFLRWLSYPANLAGIGATVGSGVGSLADGQIHVALGALVGILIGVSIGAWLMRCIPPKPE